MALTPKDRDFWPAVGAAMVDEARAKWRPGRLENGDLEPRHAQLTRAHIQLLHDVGCSRAQVLSYAAQIFSASQVSKLLSDLESYGDWVN